MSGPKDVWKWLRPGMPAFAAYACLVVVADQFQDVAMFPKILLLIAGAAVNEGVRRLGRD